MTIMELKARTISEGVITLKKSYSNISNLTCLFGIMCLNVYFYRILEHIMHYGVLRVVRGWFRAIGSHIDLELQRTWNDKNAPKRLAPTRHQLSTNFGSNRALQCQRFDMKTQCHSTTPTLWLCATGRRHPRARHCSSAPQHCLFPLNIFFTF